jgi:hypothetical protein
VQTEAPTGEYFPFAHWVQEEAEEMDFVPAAQSSQDVFADSYFPAAQLVHAVAPVEEATIPAAQAEQPEAPAVPTYVPTEHSVQVLVPADAAYFPAAHRAQEDADAPEYEPVEQSAQAR